LDTNGAEQWKHRAESHVQAFSQQKNCPSHNQHLTTSYLNRLPLEQRTFHTPILSMEDLAGQTMGLHLRPQTANPGPLADRIDTKATDNSKRKIQQDIDAQKIKRHRKRVQTSNSHPQLAEKYKDWSTAQSDTLPDRPLPLADLDELSIFMCEEILRPSKSP
jgi:hypothetical protein